MKSLTKFTKLDLPTIQKIFIDQFDGTIENIVSFRELYVILNPTFSYHYFVVNPGHFSFEKGETVGVITTKNTTGESAPWGDQSKEAERNAAFLSKSLKEIFLKEKLYVQSGGDYIAYDPTKFSKSKLFVKINGEMKRVPGLTALNIKF